MNQLPFETGPLIRIFQQYDVKKVGVFGSAARGDYQKGSDIDLMIEFSKEKSLLKFVALERKISEILGKKVDLQSEAAISPYIIESIKKDLRTIYEA